MEEVKTLGYTDKPDYTKLRSVLQQGLKSIGATDDDRLDFSASVSGAGPSSVKVRPLQHHSQVSLWRKCHNSFVPTFWNVEKQKEGKDTALEKMSRFCWHVIVRFIYLLRTANTAPHLSIFYWRCPFEQNHCVRSPLRCGENAAVPAIWERLSEVV